MASMDSSLSYDQDVKTPLYAEAVIQNYWIFNLQDNQLETYSHPYQKQNREYDYRNRQIFLANQTVSLPSFPDLALDLSRVFPR